jgi:hypothetical protein
MDNNKLNVDGGMCEGAATTQLTTAGSTERKSIRTFVAFLHFVRHRDCLSQLGNESAETLLESKKKSKVEDKRWMQATPKKRFRWMRRR